MRRFTDATGLLPLVATRNDMPRISPFRHETAVISICASGIGLESPASGRILWAFLASRQKHATVPAIIRIVILAEIAAYFWIISRRWGDRGCVRSGSDIILGGSVRCSVWFRGERILRCYRLGLVLAFGYGIINMAEAMKQTVQWDLGQCWIHNSLFCALNLYDHFLVCSGILVH